MSWIRYANPKKLKFTLFYDQIHMYMGISSWNKICAVIKLLHLYISYIQLYWNIKFRESMSKLIEILTIEIS